MLVSSHQSDEEDHTRRIYYFERHMERYLKWKKNRPVKRTKPAKKRAPATPARRVREVIIEKDELESLYLDRSWSVAKVARHYGCASETMRKALIRNGIVVRTASEQLRIIHDNKNEVRNRRIVNAYRSGQKAIEISKHEGLSRSGVILVLTQSGVPRRPRGVRPTPEGDIEKMVEYYCEGSSVMETANEFSCSKVFVHRHLKRYGVPIREPFTNRKITSSMVSDLVFQYKSGESVANIAKSVGSGVSSIYKILDREGVRKIKKAKR